MKRLGTTAVVSCVLLGSVAAAEEPFASLSFEEALKKAEAEKRLVFIDFYADWCMPCKMMDATTFKDAKVVEFLKNKVVALKIDAEKQEKLAERYHIHAYPTLLFVKPDGKVVEFFPSYVDAAGFMRLAEDVLAGKDTLSRFKQALERSPKDPLLHVLLAESLAMRGENQEALRHSLWVLEQADLEPTVGNVVPAAVAQVLMLSEASVEAETKLNQLYEAARAAVQERKAGNAQLALYAAVNLLKGDLGEVLETYDKWAAEGGDEPLARRATLLWKPELMAAERYSDIAKRVNIPEVVERMLAQVPPAQAGDSPSASDPLNPENIARGQVLGETLEYYRVLTALDRAADAEAVARQMLKVDGTAETYTTLAWTAYEMGKVKESHLALARKANELSGGKDVSILDTLARILHRLGQKEEAVKLLKDARASVQSAGERNVLEACLAEIQGEGTPTSRPNLPPRP